MRITANVNFAKMRAKDRVRRALYYSAPLIRSDVILQKRVEILAVQQNEQINVATIC